ncbi:MAG: TerB family tellurite resistance protein [Polyangiaceae bacterium]
MIWLSNSTLSRLHDQLRVRGQRLSVALPPGASPDLIETLSMTAEYGALAEAMFLMMSADGQVTNDEREVLRGALRNLSNDALRSALIDTMLDDAAKRIADEGREARMAAVTEELGGDRERAEVAFVLAAAIAFADSTIADEENEAIAAFAEALGIDEERANALLDAVEQDLGDQR